MLIMPELAVALRRELEQRFAAQEAECIQLSVWAKARTPRAEAYVRSLRTALAAPLRTILWQRGAWATATDARDWIGGELTTQADMETEGQLWLFDAINLPPTVKKRFSLPEDCRTIARVLLPIAPEGNDAPLGTAMGYLFRTAPRGREREGTPFLRLLPDLYPSEFIADPHINFVAAHRYARAHARPVAALSRAQLYTVGDNDSTL